MLRVKQISIVQCRQPQPPTRSLRTFEHRPLPYIASCSKSQIKLLIYNLWADNELCSFPPHVPSLCSIAFFCFLLAWHGVAWRGSLPPSPLRSALCCVGSRGPGRGRVGAGPSTAQGFPGFTQRQRTQDRTRTL